MRNNKTHLYYGLALFFIGLISFVAFSSIQSLMADEEDNAVSSSNYDTPPPARSPYTKLNSQLSDKALNASPVSPHYAEFYGDIWNPSDGLEMVFVRITTGSNYSQVNNFLSQSGSSIYYSQESLIYADVPTGKLVELSQIQEVQTISIVPTHPQTDIVSEGSDVHGSSSWNLKGYTGEGVKIGIIDQGFHGYSSLMGSELPSNVVAKCYLFDGTISSNISDCESHWGTGNHGTAVAEAIYDIAPGAEFFIASVGSGGIDNALAAQWMISQGVQVINMSLGPMKSYGPGDGTYIYYDSPLFAIDLAVDGGAVWVNSAGNFGKTSWYGDNFSDLDSDDWVELYPSQINPNAFERNCFFAPKDTSITANLRWDDDWPGAMNDFGLYLYWDVIPGSAELHLTNSDNWQYGLSHHEATEDITGYKVPADGQYCFKIRNDTVVNTASWLQLRVRGLPGELAYYGHNISRDGAYSLNAPSESSNPGMLSVGATNWRSPTLLEEFSSRGPTVDGRIKPDIVAVDGANSASKGEWFGTSQASPHVAGLAALVAEKFPTYTPAQITAYLKSNAAPRGESTPNNKWGYGLASLPSLTPNSPTNVNATTTLGTAEAVISWDAPSADGGDDIYQYTVTGSTNNYIATTTPFGLSGKIVSEISSNDDKISASAVDLEGRLILVGETHNGSNYDFIVARYTANGVLDTSFGTGGTTTTEFGTGDDKAKDIVLDSLGRIVVTGESHNGSDYDFAVARYDTNGNLDSTFSSDGKKTIDFYSNTDVAEAIALDGEGNIVVGGYVYDNADADVGVVRLNADGTLDNSFNSDGKTSFGFGESNDIAWDLAVDSNDRIIVVGETDLIGSSEDAAIFRLTGSGILDTSFGSDGATIIDQGTGLNSAYSVNIDNQGKIVVAGLANNGTDFDFSLFRLNPTGTLDESFTSTLTDFSSGTDAAIDSFIDGNGRIVLSGHSISGGTSDFALVRYGSNGLIDSSFGNSGKTTVDFDSTDDRSYSVIGLSKGNILATGSTEDSSSKNFALLRLDSSGNLSSGLKTTATGLSPGTSYTFTVLAENSVGTSTSSSASNAIVPIIPPGKPINIAAIPGNNQAEISWNSPSSNGGSAIVMYSVYSDLLGGLAATTTQTFSTITGLTNGVPHSFTVRASNISGMGESSDVSEVVTPAAVPDSPENISGTMGDGRILLTWTAPNDNGSSITLYTVTSNPGNLTTTSTSTSVVVTGLDNGTPYSFTVTATNSSGESPSSSSSSSVTPMGIPGIPTSLSANSSASNSATVTWNEPSLNGGGVDYYTLISSPGSVTISSATTTATLTGLTNGTSYTFKVSATNVAGTSTLSINSNAITPAALPGVPSSINVTAGDSQVTIGWTAPADNGNPITYYTVTSDNGISATTTATSTVIAGLDNGTSYSFTVAATNGVGTGPSSDPSASVAPLTVPSVPTNVVATSTSGQSALVSWDIPSSNGGSVISHYSVVTNPGSLISTTTTNSLDISNLVNGTVYSFTVFASNISGSSPSSTPSNTVTPVDVPETPSNVVATGGNKQATVSWTAPSNNGSPISIYTISVIPAGASATTTGTSILIGNLDNSTSYRFRVVATNAVGDSPPSDLSNIVVPAPTNFTVETEVKSYSNEGQSPLLT